MVYNENHVKQVDEILRKFSKYAGVDLTDTFEYARPDTEIDFGLMSIDFREFVELETGYYITDSNWINTGIFTWEKLVEHLNKWVKKEVGILASFKIDANGSLSIPAGKSPEELIKCICDYADATKPYNPVKNISIEKYYRCAKGSPSQCEQFYGGNGILFMSESDCGKYYYWEDYNSKNELIFFRGEKSWVEDNYQKFNFLDKKEDNSVNVSDNVGNVVGKIKDRWEDNRVGCVDNQLVKTSDVERFEDSVPESDLYKAYRYFGNMVNSLDDTKRITLKGTLEEKKAALLKELSSEDEYTREDSDILKVVATTRKGFTDVLSNKETNPTPIKSDGGKSDYYKIELPQWLLDKHSEKGFIMLEDLAEIMFENDFNFTNVFKAQKRMFELTKGQGKAGNDFEYDATKCKYYTDKQVEVFNRNKK